MHNINDQDYFRIGDNEFNYDRDNCTLAIDNSLKLKIRAHSSRINEWQETIIYSHEEVPQGNIDIELSAKGIHQAGIPTGSFEFNLGLTDKPKFLSMRLRGITRTLLFSGTVIFENGNVTIDGSIADRRKPTPVLPIQVSYQLDVKSLDWTKYQFVSMEEIRTAEPHSVRKLSLSGETFYSLPKDLLALTHIEKLYISHSTASKQSESPDAKYLPDAIGELTTLTYLSIGGTQLGHLPETIGKLSSLEYLSFSSCQLKSTPESLWQLPKLQNLCLRNNQLSSVPAKINLPEITSIDLSHNVFQTLDTAIVHQPKLHSLTLNDNPWESLDSIFKRVNHLSLSIDDQRRLLNIDFLKGR